MPYLDAPNNARLYYDSELSGSGATALFSHGFGASARMWSQQTSALSGTRPWIAWDNRGHGYSETPTAAPCHHDQAILDITALTSLASADKAVLIGHSMGGYLSLAYALARPDDVAGLILVGAGPGFRSEKARAQWNAYANKIAERLEGRGLSALGDGAETNNANHQNPIALARAARNLLAHADTRVMDILDQLRTPTLIIVGDGDERFTPAAQYMARKIHNAQIETIPNAGHAPNIDAPETFNSAMNSFLSTL